jgi:hypothetical protein
MFFMYNSSEPFSPEIMSITEHYTKVGLILKQQGLILKNLGAG